ncbi:MAG TPA: FCSD flavin-binding domain-containing protein [Geminicoccaceae bacterium]|nr:FCSD flavin-binding domain-containing protein [Geminicoccaceae bacterium]
MDRRTRRDFLKLAGGAPAAGLLAGRARAQARPRVVVVGGGFGGATCAKYLRRTDPGIAVTLVEPAERFVTCPFSNAVLGGLRDLDSITFGYDGLRERHGVEVVRDTAVEVDPAARTVTLRDGGTLPYDRLVLSPGIELRWGALEGYDEPAAEDMPHAWKAGPQTALLRRQLEAMDDGGVVAIVVPEAPYRCPPGPYERASLIAHYLKTQKPRSKLLVLDAKDGFSKQGLFTSAWEELYPGLLEWVSGSLGGRVVRVDPKAMTLHTDFDEYEVAVANVIPPQRAAAVARSANLDEAKGWCAVDGRTFESVVHAGVHLLGDAILAGAMPKSAFSANNQAKACAAAIAALLRGEPPPEPALINTCYSLVAPDYGISIAGVYRIDEGGGIVEVEGAGGLSPQEADAGFRRLEADYARSWYANVTADGFA